MRITWQVCVIIGVCLIALALPIAGVVLTLQTLTKGDARQSERHPIQALPGLLENVLEGIADEKLAPEELENEEMKIELSALDVQMERERIERILKSVGGISIPTSESQSEIRLLVRVPADRLAEFLDACVGEGARSPAGDLMEIVIRKTKVQ